MELERGQISTLQGTVLAISSVFPTTLLFLPSLVVARAGRGGWLSIALAAAVGLVAAILHAALASRFPRQTLVGYARRLVGFVPGTVLAMAFMAYLVILGVIIARSYGELLTTAVLPETPIIVLIGLTFALSAVSVRGGVEVIGRVAEIVIPVVVTFVLLILAAATPRFDPGLALPPVEAGLTGIVRGVLPTLVFFTGTATGLMYFPFFARPGEILAAGAAGVAVAGVIVGLAVFGVTALFGPELAARLTFPTLSLVQIIGPAQFLERLEALVVVIWVASGHAGISVTHYALSLGLAEILGLRDYRPVVLPLGIIVAAVSILSFGNIVNLVEFLARHTVFMVAVAQVGLPAFLLAVAGLRKQGRWQAG